MAKLGGTAFACFVSTSAILVAAPAAAQSNDDGRRELEQIVVTAQKKEENLQRVPASISAFNETAIEQKRIMGIEDLAEFTPGLYSNPNAADANGLRLSLRGVGTFDPQLGLDSRVAIYIDGLYLGKTQGLSFDMPDLARVEVLKGPQGTLYGRNAVAGAINLISARPDTEEVSGRVMADYGSFNTVRTQGVINLPLSEKAALRVSGLYNSRNGWVENEGPGDDFGGFERWGGRAALGLYLTDNFTVDVAADYMRTENEAFFYQQLAGTASDTAIFTSALNAFDGRQESVTTTFPINSSELENWGAQMTASYDWSDNDNIKLTAGWRRAESNRFVTLAPDANPAALNGILNADLDQDPTNGIFSINGALSLAPALIGLSGGRVRPDYADAIPRGEVDTLFASVFEGQPNLDEHEQFSVELTATGSILDEAVDYTLGLYYFDEDTANSRTPLQQNPRDAQDYLNVLAVLGAFATLDGERIGQVLDGARLSSAANLEIATQAFAAYGQFTWHITDRLRATGGLRFSIEERDGFQQVVSPFFYDTTTLLGNPIAPNIETIDFDSIDPAFVIEYDVADNFLVYASRKESFRAGGFNETAVANNLPGETFGSDFVFDKEEITSYEGGFKADLLNNRLRLNAAGFYYDFTNEQTTVQTDPIITTQRVIANTDTEIWGAEVDAILLIGERFTLAGSYAYTDGNPGDQVNPINGEVIVRDNLQQAPRNSYNITLDYAENITDRIGLFGTVNYSHRDSTEVTPRVRLTDQDLVSLRVGVNYDMPSGDQAFLALWVENLTDDEFTIDNIDFTSFANSAVVFGQPRMIGASMGLRF